MNTVGNAATSGSGAPGSGFVARPRWEDLSFELLAVSIPGSNKAPDPVPIPGTGLFIAGFPAIGITEVPISGKEYPHGAVLAEPGKTPLIKPHFHVQTAITGTGTAYMQLELRATRPGKSPFHITVGASFTPPPVAFDQEIIVELPDIDISTIADGIGTQLTARFFRDPSHPSDTFTGEVGVTTLGWHVQIDADGSREVMTK